jgi:hypothetical protein
MSSHGVRELTMNEMDAVAGGGNVSSDYVQAVLATSTVTTTMTVSSNGSASQANKIMQLTKKP